MSVHYKFKSAIEFNTLSVDGVHISVGDLKEAIIEQKKLSRAEPVDLIITNAETNEEYKCEKALIPKNSSLLIARVPIDPSQMKKPWNKRLKEPTELLLSNPANLINCEDSAEAIKLSLMAQQVTDLTKMQGTEQDRIHAMMAQSTLDYHPSRYVKQHSSRMSGKVPVGYTCSKCSKGGHWITDCRLSNQDLRKSYGIPSDQLIRVDDPNTPGVMVTTRGTLVIHRNRPVADAPLTVADEPEPERLPIPEDLACSLCEDLVNDAVIVPCCAQPFCDDCIRNHLIESQDTQCPKCTETISIGNLITILYLRKKVIDFDKTTNGKYIRPYEKQYARPPASVAPLPPHLITSNKPKPSPLDSPSNNKDENNSTNDNSLKDNMDLNDKESNQTQPPNIRVESPKGDSDKENSNDKPATLVETKEGKSEISGTSSRPISPIQNSPHTSVKGDEPPQYELYRGLINDVAEQQHEKEMSSRQASPNGGGSEKTKKKKKKDKKKKDSSKEKKKHRRGSKSSKSPRIEGDSKASEHDSPSTGTTDNLLSPSQREVKRDNRSSDSGSSRGSSHERKKLDTSANTDLFNVALNISTTTVLPNIYSQTEPFYPPINFSVPPPGYAGDTVVNTGYNIPAIGSQLIDDPLALFNKHLQEKDERKRREQQIKRNKSPPPYDRSYHRRSYSRSPRRSPQDWRKRSRSPRHRYRYSRSRSPISPRHYSSRGAKRQSPPPSHRHYSPPPRHHRDSSPHPPPPPPRQYSPSRHRQGSPPPSRQQYSPPAGPRLSPSSSRRRPSPPSSRQYYDKIPSRSRTRSPSFYRGAQPLMGSPPREYHPPPSHQQHRPLALHSPPHHHRNVSPPPPRRPEEAKGDGRYNSLYASRGHQEAPPHSSARRDGRSAKDHSAGDNSDNRRPDGSKEPPPPKELSELVTNLATAPIIAALAAQQQKRAQGSPNKYTNTPPPHRRSQYPGRRSQTPEMRVSGGKPQQSNRSHSPRGDGYDHHKNYRDHSDRGSRHIGRSRHEEDRERRILHSKDDKHYSERVRDKSRDRSPPYYKEGEISRSGGNHRDSERDIRRRTPEKTNDKTVTKSERSDDSYKRKSSSKERSRRWSVERDDKIKHVEREKRDPDKGVKREREEQENLTHHKQDKKSHDNLLIREKDTKKEKDVAPHSQKEKVEDEKNAVKKSKDDNKLDDKKSKHKDKSDKKREKRKKKKEKKERNPPQSETSQNDTTLEEEPKKKKRKHAKESSELFNTEMTELHIGSNSEHNENDQILGSNPTFDPSLLPELSKWERDDLPDNQSYDEKDKDEKHEKPLVTSDVLRKAESALFHSRGRLGRVLLPRKGHMEFEKAREDFENQQRMKDEDFTVDRLEGREAKRKGPSIQITISSKTEIDIGKKKDNQQNEESAVPDDTNCNNKTNISPDNKNIESLDIVTSQENNEINTALIEPNNIKNNSSPIQSNKKVNSVSESESKHIPSIKDDKTDIFTSTNANLSDEKPADSPVKCSPKNTEFDVKCNVKKEISKSELIEKCSIVEPIAMQAESLIRSSQELLEKGSTVLKDLTRKNSAELIDTDHKKKIIDSNDFKENHHSSSRPQSRTGYFENSSQSCLKDTDRSPNNGSFSPSLGKTSSQKDYREHQIVTTHQIKVLDYQYSRSSSSLSHTDIPSRLIRDDIRESVASRSSQEYDGDKKKKRKKRKRSVATSSSVSISSSSSDSESDSSDEERKAKKRKKNKKKSRHSDNDAELKKKKKKKDKKKRKKAKKSKKHME